MFTAILLAQLCAPTPAAGVPIERSEGGMLHSIAAGAAGVLVSWVSRTVLPMEGSGNLGGQTETDGNYALLDAATLSRVPNPPLMNGGGSFSEQGWHLGVAPLFLGDGSPATAACEATMAYGTDDPRTHMERGGCSLGGPAFGRAVPSAQLAAGAPPQHNRIAALGTGARTALVALPHCQQLRVWNTATTRFTNVAEGSADACGAGGVEVPVLTSDGAGGAYALWRQGGQLRGRSLDAAGAPRGPVVNVSPRGDVGAPAAYWSNGGLTVVYAGRANGRAPYQLQLVRWAPPAAPAAPVTLATSAEPAVAPALAATAQPGCSVLSWTDGRGTGTFVRMGRLCANAIVPGSVAQLSHPGVEAGDSELAGAPGGNVYAVWQELTGPRRRAGLHVARVQCP